MIADLTPDMAMTLGAVGSVVFIIAAILVTLYRT